MKYITVTIGVLILAGIFGVYVFFFSAKPSVGDSSTPPVLFAWLFGNTGGNIGGNRTNNTNTNTGSAATSSATIVDKEGRLVHIADVLPKEGTRTSYESGAEEGEVGWSAVSLLGSELPADAAYDIVYFPENAFSIILLKEPIAETRIAAENDFLKRLGVSKEAACRLDYVLVTSPALGTFYSGKNLGFSFCPGAIAL